MTIDASRVDNINTLTGNNNRSDAQEALDIEFENFLTLLTTQLQNQDPTEPFDTNQLTEQIASLSTVSGINQTNVLLEDLVNATSASQVDNAVNYIGRVVEAPVTNGDRGQGQLLTDGENLAALFVYDLPAEAESAEIIIRDQQGGIRFRGEALPEIGRNEVVWDGFNSGTEEFESPGNYSFEINALDAAGNPIAVDYYTSGVVTAVNIDGNDATLALSELELDIDEVTAVRSF